MNIDPVGNAIADAEHAENETSYRNQLAREMGDAGYRRGEAEGYARAVAEMKQLDHEAVTDLESEVSRWGPGGRAHFADPRPGDFPGRQHEREREMEAG